MQRGEWEKSCTQMRMLDKLWYTQKNMVYLWYAAYTICRALSKLSIAGYHFAKFGSRSHCGSGDITY